MPEIIPAIIPKDFQELQEKVKLVEPYVKIVQIDVMDGIFVPNETWREPADLENLETDLFLEAHLMMAEPEKVIDGWLVSKVGRIIIHWEILENSKLKTQNSKLKTQNSKPQLKIQNLIDRVRGGGKEFGIALNLETPINVLDNFIGEIDLVLLMGVNPGFAGQEFQADVIQRIKALRQEHPNVKIEVDGGISLQNVKKLVEAGADFLAVGSAIFEAQDIGQAIQEFQSDLSVVKY